jgi:hypothetical protein
MTASDAAAITPATNRRSSPEILIWTGRLRPTKEVHTLRYSMELHTLPPDTTPILELPNLARLVLYSKIL